MWARGSHTFMSTTKQRRGGVQMSKDHLAEVRHDAIFLLVRQQRIDQIPAEALRYCMRSEELGLVDTFASLHHQEPVWLHPIFSPICMLLLPRDPPNVVFHRETVAMRAQI